MEDTLGILLEGLNAKENKEKMADDQDPGERVRKLVQSAGQVHVDNSIAPKKYFRSGIEMEKMVSLYSPVHIIHTTNQQRAAARCWYRYKPTVNFYNHSFLFEFYDMKNCKFIVVSIYFSFLGLFVLTIICKQRAPSSTVSSKNRN